MKPSISILCTGNEILDGRIEDSNSRYLIRSLEDLGFEVGQIMACRDDTAAIVNSIRFLLESARLLIVSGGLGPTSDDLTREAVAEFIGRPLYLDGQALEALKARYRERKRRFDGSNTKQAQFPEGSVILANPVGTAAGFRCTLGADPLQQKHIAVVPGVPHELRRMFDDCLKPLVLEVFGHPERKQTQLLRIFGRPEAKVCELVEAHGVPEGVHVSYRAHYPEIMVKFSAAAEHGDFASFVERAREAIGRDYVFSESSERNFEQSLHTLVLEKKLTLATAESCTGGGIGALLTSTPGSSAYYAGGVVSYSNNAKTTMLDVPALLIEKHGAVSAEVASAMARGARERFGTDVAISVTGIAGPDGGSAEKPVGTFYVGLADSRGARAFNCFAVASRGMLRTFAAYTALDVVRRYARGFELRPRDIIGVPQQE